MSQVGADTCPQVFVVDSQVSHITIPSVRKKRLAKEGWKLILLLVGLSMLGIAVEGYFIHDLYRKKEGATFSKQVGFKEEREIRTLMTRTQQWPHAHLLGSKFHNHSDVVQWEIAGEAIIQNMTYEKGALIVQQPGVYYLYSKLQLHSNGDHTVIRHKVMRNTTAYEKPMELMKSIKSNNKNCRNRKEERQGNDQEDLWNTFLAGIFELQKEDRIYVTLDKIQTMRVFGHTDNFIGAFMIAPKQI